VVASRAPDALFEFGNERTAPRHAREALEPLFSASGMSSMSDLVRLAASELVSNVVLHTENGGILRIWVADGAEHVRLEVEDREPRLPEPSADATEGGRGLHILDDIAGEWGVQSTGHGKVVWAEFEGLVPSATL
jgi:anti-sigma regulatory factor (Ser/Thr protein kinase)